MSLAGAAIVAAALLAAGRVQAADPAGPSLLTAPPRPSAAKPRAADVDAATYDRCMKLAKENPAAARDLAADWRKRGGAHPADHCFAVALIGLKQYEAAATRLETLAQAMVRAPATLRAEVLGQAGQAWQLAGDPARAYVADGAALELQPDDADLLTDRAEAAGSAGWFDKAVVDLDRVLTTNPSRLDALVYRASANRALERLDPALDDIDAALKLAPDSVAALLERGNIRRLKGDLPGARQDWLRVAKLAPGSAAEAAAKANIERLDVRDEPAPATTPGPRR
jgi:tetratricopeptide (TPR) repeat protein